MTLCYNDVMKKKRFTIEDRWIWQNACKYFGEHSKTTDGNIAASFLAKSIAYGDDFRHRTEMKAIAGFFRVEKKSKNVFSIGEHSIGASFFEQIPSKAVLGAFVYGLRIEENTPGKDAVMEYLWRISYLDSACMFMREYAFRKNSEYGFPEDVLLTPPLGPGYFGIDVSTENEIMDILKEKTPCDLLAFHFILDREGGEKLSYPLACKTCIGNKQGCDLCRVDKHVFL